MKHIVNLSGGKDSTAMLLEMIARKMPIDYIVFADTGKDWEQMLKHIDELERFIGRPIIRLKGDKSFDYLMFDHIKTTGKNKGKAGYTVRIGSEKKAGSARLTHCVEYETKK